MFTSVLLVSSLICIAIVTWVIWKYMEGAGLPTSSKLAGIMYDHGFKVKGGHVTISTNEMERAIRLLGSIAKHHHSKAVREEALGILLGLYQR